MQNETAHQIGEIRVDLGAAGIYRAQRDKVIREGFQPLLEKAACVFHGAAHPSFITSARYNQAQAEDGNLALVLYPGGSVDQLGNGRIDPSHCSSCKAKEMCTGPQAVNPGLLQQDVHERAFLGSLPTPLRTDGPHSPYAPITTHKSDGGTDSRLDNQTVRGVADFMRHKRDYNCAYGGTRNGDVVVAEGDSGAVTIQNESGPLVQFVEVHGSDIKMVVHGNADKEQRLFKPIGCNVCPIGHNGVVLPGSGKLISCTKATSTGTSLNNQSDRAPTYHATLTVSDSWNAKGD